MFAETLYVTADRITSHLARFGERSAISCPYGNY
jgi:hypothetical protein